MPRLNLSLAEARRLALAAQGFDRPRPQGRRGLREIERIIRRLGVLQLDYVNVLLPAHYQVLFSRLGPYQRSHLDDLIYRKRRFTEQWAHMASVVPMECWPLLEFRREEHHKSHRGFNRLLRHHRSYAAQVLAAVRDRGPLEADDLHSPKGVDRRIANAWIGTVPRAVLEAYFGRGLLAVADRRPNFARSFDLAERIIPAQHYQRRVTPEKAQRELLLRAARAHGVGTADDLADYFRMPMRIASPRLAELVESGRLHLVTVEGWSKAAYLHPRARVPRRLDARALLSPFDPVVWHRPRAARLFGFDYRVEIFIPAAQRKWGVYVLPFLLGDRLVARVDLKSDRPGKRLLVLGAYIEAGVDADDVVSSLTAELTTMAQWLGLNVVEVRRRGSLTRPLAAAMRA